MARIAVRRLSGKEEPRLEWPILPIASFPARQSRNNRWPLAGLPLSVAPEDPWDVDPFTGRPRFRKCPD